MEDSEEIKNRILDYVEGWYQSDTARMQRTLSPHLAKRRIVSSEEIWEVNKDWMVTATGEGKGKLAVPENGRKEITILDQTETMASVKIISEEFYDYVHLAKVDNAWSIVNVLWDYLPKN